MLNGDSCNADNGNNNISSEIDFFPTESHMKRLKNILDHFADNTIKIVISSSWKAKIESLYQLFIAMDLIGINVFDYVIGVTPQFTQDTMINMNLREFEIETWLYVCVSNINDIIKYNHNSDVNDKHDNANANEEQKDQSKNDNNEKDDDNQTLERNLKEKVSIKMNEIIDYYGKDYGNYVNIAKYLILDDRKLDESKLIIKNKTFIQTNVNGGMVDQDVELAIKLLE